MKLVRVLVASLLIAASALGQAANARYELAVRLRALDRAWLELGRLPKTEQDARRQRAVPSIETAVQSFFRGNIGAAAADLDVARHTLGGARHPHWYDALSVTPVRRLCDASEKALCFEVAHFYPPENMQDIVFTGGVVGETTERLEEELDSFETDPPWREMFTLVGLASGDHQVWTSLFNGDFVESKRTMTLSIVEKRDERLAALEKQIAELPQTAPRLERETASALLVLLKSLASGSTEETDYPAARLLGECEQVVADSAKGERWYDANHPGDFWLALPAGKSAARVRVFVPNDLKLDKPVPLVIALHGAGGSENMFFDTYGAGAIVKLCEQRGWLLVAPRLALVGAAPLDAIVDALAERYPVDRARLLLVGHSMGAAAGINAVSNAPTKYRAFAALGGGHAPKDANALAELPIFVGIGERDFGRATVEKLHALLVAAGSKKATLSVYPKCEHLMVVADALPDVFRFFDEAVAAK